MFLNVLMQHWKWSPWGQHNSSLSIKRLLYCPKSVTKKIYDYLTLNCRQIFGLFHSKNHRDCRGCTAWLLFCRTWEVRLMATLMFILFAGYDHWAKLKSNVKIKMLLKSPMKALSSWYAHCVYTRFFYHDFCYLQWKVGPDHLRLRGRLKTKFLKKIKIKFLLDSAFRGLSQQLSLSHSEFTSLFGLSVGSGLWSRVGFSNLTKLQMYVFIKHFVIAKTQLLLHTAYSLLQYFQQFTVS